MLVQSVLVSLAALAAAAPSQARKAVKPRDASDYAPKPAPCPSTPLTRAANGISSSEAAYINSRKPVADAALKAWLAKTDGSFGEASTYPTLGLAVSGGGFRSLLSGAGVHQALDGRDSNTTVSGLYQAMTYEAGLSGGNWLLGSIAQNNWPTISSLQTNLWETTFNDGLPFPGGLEAPIDYVEIAAAVLDKDKAGFSPTIVDPYGRALGYALLEASEGGIQQTLSGLTTLSNFTSFNAPFPIVSSIGVASANGTCFPPMNATQFELNPYEFGSWDTGINAFAQMHYIGSDPVSGSCVTGYDNQGYIMGTSSDVFNGLCKVLPGTSTTSSNPFTELVSKLESLLDKIHPFDPARDLLSVYPNPFQGSTGSPVVSSLSELTLADGGETHQNDPVWPSLHRQVDALLVNDNSDDINYFPNGTDLYNTYLQAQAKGLTRMPVIPEPSVFVANGYSTRPTFFGCNDANVMTIVYLPNTNYTYASNEPTYKLQYSKAETDAMIANGNLIGSYNNNATFGTCVGCALMKKTGASLPSACTECLSDFCYN